MLDDKSQEYLENLLEETQEAFEGLSERLEWIAA